MNHHSLPIYRRGLLLSATSPVSGENADVVAARVVERAADFREAFITKTRAVGGSDYRPAKSEDTERENSTKRVFKFPAVTLRVGRYDIKARSSLTVCVGDRRSKIWTGLTCLELDGEPARSLSAQAVKDYFDAAEGVAAAALEGLLQAYRQHLAAVGIRLRRGRPYSFSFRAYNSHGMDAKRLFDELNYQLTLKQALHEERFGSQLHDFFGVAIEDGDKLSEEELINWPSHPTKSSFKDIFIYTLPERRALCTLRSTKRHTDVCGFGYDKRGLKPGKTLAALASSGLIDEFAHRF